MTVILGISLAIAPAIAATAAAGDPVVTWEGQSSVSIEYGQDWGFQATARPADTTNPNLTVTSVKVNNAPSGYKPGVSSYVRFNDHPGGVSTISVYQGWDSRPLSAGSYTIDLGIYYTVQPEVMYSVPAPASVVVAPAALGIDLRVLADSSNPSAAIVSARFTGRFVDEYQSSVFSGSALSPAGNWHIVVKDEAGTVAVERTIERAAGDDVLATSFYWPEAEMDKEYTATAEFVSTGASVANFDIDPATAFSYTAQEDPRPTPSSNAAATPEELPERAGFALPLWTVLLDIVLILALGTLVTVLVIRLRSRPALPSRVEGEK